MGRLIDADNFGNRMYHEVFEKDSEDQRWDSGCWMRYRLFEKVLREQPTVPQWIPCSERLPERDFVNVLVCLRDVRIGCEHSYYFAEAHVSRGQWNMTLESDISDLEIIAWMPLPEPYKEGQDGSDR